jgi:cation:H+ antiporter
MPPLLSVALIIASCLLLIKGTNLFINSASKISRFLGLSGFTISFLLIAMSTSLPETMVGITSALDKNPLLAFGNAIGSNIALLTLVISVPILISKGVRTKHLVRSNEVYHMMFFALIPIVMVMDGVLTRIEGIILISAYVAHAVYLVRKSTGLQSFIDKFEHNHIKVGRQVIVFVFSLILILASSEAVLIGAKSLSSVLNWNLGFIGLTITAVGTSLPELAFVIAAIKKHRDDDVLGDITGGVVANSTFVLGITALIYPIRFGDSDLGVTTILFLILALMVFLQASKSKEKLERKEAYVLLTIYVLFVVTEYFIQ